MRLQPRAASRPASAPVTPVSLAARASRAARAAVAAVAAVTALACEPQVPPAVPPAPDPPPDPPSTAAAPPAPAAPRRALPRPDLNRIAQELDLPLFWAADLDRSGAADPAEVVAWNFPARPAPPPRWTDGGRFTPAFDAAFEAIARVHAGGHERASLPEAERRRRDAVLRELAQGRPALVRWDFRDAPEEDRALVRHVLAASAIIERIYLKQRGAAGLDAGIPADDPASRALFRRNQGPWCEQARTRQDPDCSALPSRPPRVSGLYPTEIQRPGFCETLERRADQAALLDPFTVVASRDGKLAAQPYHETYRDEMQAVSRELTAAADAVKSPGESALRAYLRAAAQAFLDNRWEPADEAWAAMNATNSRWYLRIGPDEVSADPCARKAGFHVSFARINQASLTWQRTLDPLKADMEAALAALAGPPYRARPVSFRLPDFIDIVNNAGDSRAPVSGVAGQSLPNWGRVANQARGRTMVVLNLFEDEDSVATNRAMADALACPASAPLLPVEPGSLTMSTVLHEAAHNLGPSHDYRANGKKAGEAFGGGLAAMLEELKAQTAALHFASWLAGRGVIERAAAERALGRDIVWSFKHIAGGMTTPDGKPEPYGQLAAIQVGRLLDAGAMEWHPAELAANGKDRGCFTLRLDRFPATIEALAREVLGIKARGDKAAALKLTAAYVDGSAPWKEAIRERALRSPQASLLYAVELP